MGDALQPIFEWLLGWWFWGAGTVCRLFGWRLDHVMIGHGARFFASRDALDQAGSLDDRLRSADTIDAVFLTGQTLLWHEHPRIRTIRRLIIPDPTSASFRFFAESVKETEHLAKYIEDVSAKSQDEFRIEVRWCPDLIYQSILIGDADKRTRWVHVELILPASKDNTRPSFIVQRSRFENVVKFYVDGFEKLWAESKQPPNAVGKDVTRQASKP